MEIRGFSTEKINSGIGLSRNLIIDQFVLASSIFGFIYAGVVLWRDLTVGVVSVNSIVNCITAIIPTTLWFFRHRVNYNVKAATLFFTYLIISVKSVILFGTYSNSAVIFLCFCSLIIALSVNYKWSIILIFLISLIIPLRGYFHLNGMFPLETGMIGIISNNSTSWIQLYVTFILTASILAIGSRQLRVEVSKYIILLQQSIQAQKSANDQLNGQVKELSVLYRISLLLSKGNQSLEESLQEIVLILPQGSEYPEFCAARIRVFEKLYMTPNFRESPRKVEVVLKVAGERIGFIEVVYVQQKTEDAAGPFLSDEKGVINVIAEVLQIYLERKREEDALNKAQANLLATINNTETLIWSVDKDFNLLTFNEPFIKFVQLHYNTTLKIGTKILTLTDEFDQNTLWVWGERYRKALQGETVKVEEATNGFDFRFSLGPIIERGDIIGISVFADNITERKRRDRELAEANIKIGELKLMALRSVMNPHFVFNVLNSIQFFISKNDRLNAITYLTTFSKLIRNILTHSVDNKIKLADEIEMLNNYVQLEMVRFEHKFKFILNVDPAVDSEAIEIPSLLIQPYVENAILHGLYNKKGAGTLKIDIYEENGTIIFQIEDDGIGREAAMKLRMQNFPTHKSMGIHVTEERLQLINQKHNVAFEVVDLEENGTPSGTRVRIGVIC